MSSTLYWQPVKNPDTTLDDSIKFLLRERYGFPVDVEFDGENVAYLEGAMHASSSKEMKKDLKALINAILKHGSVRVFEGNW